MDRTSLPTIASQLRYAAECVCNAGLTMDADARKSHILHARLSIAMAEDDLSKIGTVPASSELEEQVENIRRAHA